MNNCTFTGRIATKPLDKTDNKGLRHFFAQFAVDDKVLKENENRNQLFISISAEARLADYLLGNMKVDVGDYLLIQASAKPNRYTGKDGVVYQGVCYELYSVEPLESKEQKNARLARNAQQASNQTQPQSRQQNNNMSNQQYQNGARQNYQYGQEPPVQQRQYQAQNAQNPQNPQQTMYNNQGGWPQQMNNGFQMSNGFQNQNMAGQQGASQQFPNSAGQQIQQNNSRSQQSGNQPIQPIVPGNDFARDFSEFLKANDNSGINMDDEELPFN